MLQGTADVPGAPVEIVKPPARLDLPSAAQSAYQAMSDAGTISMTVL
jgi:hypothetical protein